MFEISIHIIESFISLSWPKALSFLSTPMNTVVKYQATITHKLLYSLNCWYFRVIANSLEKYYGPSKGQLILCEYLKYYRWTLHLINSSNNYCHIFSKSRELFKAKVESFSSAIAGTTSMRALIYWSFILTHQCQPQHKMFTSWLLWILSCLLARRRLSLIWNPLESKDTKSFFCC